MTAIELANELIKLVEKLGHDVPVYILAGYHYEIASVELRPDRCERDDEHICIQTADE